MNKTQTISIGLFFIVGAFLIWIVFNALSEESVSQTDGYEVTAVFDTLLQLRVGDDVRMAGVRVGSVQSVALVDRQPTAIFKIFEEFQIPADSSATIAMAGLLGNNLVSINMGNSNTYLSDGDLIRTEAGFNISAVVNEIGNLSQNAGIAFENISEFLGSDADGEASLFDNFNAILIENKDPLGQTISNLESITAQMQSGEGTLGRLLMDDSIYNKLEVATTEIQNTLAEAEALFSETREIVAQVQSGEGTLGGLIYGESDIAAEVELLIANLQEFSANLNNPDSTIGRLLNDDQLYDEVQGLMRKANQTLDGLGESAPISAVGAAANGLF